MRYIIDLDEHDLRKIGDALDLMPYGIVHGLVKDIQAQITVQEEAAREKLKSIRKQEASQAEKNDGVGSDTSHGG